MRSIQFNRGVWMQRLYYAMIAAVVVIAIAGIATKAVDAYAASTNSQATDEAIAQGKHVLTIHDDGTQRALITDASTLREAFKKANFEIGDHDITEPGLDEELTAGQYEVNIYRARPVEVVDGDSTQKIMTAYSTPEQIVKDAGITTVAEDQYEVTHNASITTGVVEAVKIDRATKFTLVFYGRQSIVYTQAKTVGDYLQSQNITLGANDRMSLAASDVISSDKTLKIWREGRQTVTEDEDIDFTVRQVEDASKKVGYREVESAGEKGKQTVTYEVLIRDGKEVSRKALKKVVTKKPVEQVEIVGTKPDFDGDFAAALAKLRSCEGGYDSWNPAGPYYGAYQFDQGTWSSVSSAPYGSATPAEQDAAARALYLRRGWSPWPVCGANLPDTYR